MSFLRRVRRFFVGCENWRPRPGLRAQTVTFHKARIVVRCYYAALLFLAAETTQDWTVHLGRRDALPLWPVWWLHAVPLRAGMLGILAGYLVAAFLGVVFANRRWARTLAFLGLLEFVALDNSFGKINHNQHLWVLTAFCLVFLPDISARVASRTERQRYLMVFWACQAITLLTYTMSGVGKVAGAIYQLSAGQNNILMPTGLAEIIANRLLQTDSTSWLGPWFIAHPWFGWPLGLVSVYLEFFAIWVAFRPALQRWWAAGLILFHIGVFLTMRISFSPAVLLVGLLFFASPFRREEDGGWRTVKQLPLLSWMWRNAFPHLLRTIASVRSL